MYEDERGGLFPEMTGSYKVVLVMQMFACYILVVSLGIFFESWFWGTVAFALDTLKDCFVVTAMIQASRANAISEETQRKLHDRNAMFTTNEGRLLDRGSMEPAPPTLEMPGAGQPDSWSS